MSWIGLLDGVGAALLIIGVLGVVAGIAQLIASAIAQESMRVGFWFAYGLILTGCLILGATP